jgi:hypothetical protein
MELFVKDGEGERRNAPIAISAHEGDVRLHKLRHAVWNFERDNLMALGSQRFHGFHNGSLACRHRLEIPVAGHVGDLQSSLVAILSNLRIPGKARDGRVFFTVEIMRERREVDQSHSQNHRGKEGSHHSLAISDTETGR